MDDLDSLFEGELADINQMFQEFEVKDKKKEQRTKTEEEDLKQVPTKDVTDAAPTLEAFEEVSKRRSIQSMNIEQQWEEEMQALEQERLKALEQQQAQEEADDSLLQDLDNQLKTLIQTKEQEVKVAQQIAQQNKILKEQKEKEERERKEKERLERLARAKDSPLADGDMELTVEEWIAWMEEKKKQGMTEAQQEEYERRKKAYQEKRREREEKLRLEEEEKRRKTREKIESEMLSYSQRQKEVIESRLTEEELRQKQEELAMRQQEEARLRKERGVKMRREDRERELEEMKPKARSALAARWEESVKSRSNGKPQSREDHKATVITGKRSPEFRIDKEEERLTRRISGGYPNGGVSLSPEKRRSIQ